MVLKIKGGVGGRRGTWGRDGRFGKGVEEDEEQGEESD